MVQDARSRQQGPCNSNDYSDHSQRKKNTTRRQEDKEIATTGVMTTVSTTCPCRCDNKHYYLEEEQRQITTGEIVQGEGNIMIIMIKIDSFDTIMQDIQKENIKTKYYGIVRRCRPTTDWRGTLLVIFCFWDHKLRWFIVLVFKEFCLFLCGWPHAEKGKITHLLIPDHRYQQNLTGQNSWIPPKVVPKIRQKKDKIWVETNRYWNPEKQSSCWEHNISLDPALVEYPKVFHRCPMFNIWVLLPFRHAWLCIPLLRPIASAKMTSEWGPTAAEFEETSVSGPGNKTLEMWANMCTRWCYPGTGVVGVTF